MPSSQASPTLRDTAFSVWTKQHFTFLGKTRLFDIAAHEGRPIGFWLKLARNLQRHYRLLRVSQSTWYGISRLCCGGEDSHSRRS